MEITLAVVIQLLTWIVFIFVNRLIFTPALLGFVYLNFNFIGSLLMASENHNYLTPLFLAFGMLSIAFGQLITKITCKFNIYKEVTLYRNAAPVSAFIHNKAYIIALSIVTCFSVLMGCFLFLKGGIPLVGENPELERFTFLEGNGFYYRFVSVFLPLYSMMWLSSVLTYKNSMKKISLQGLTISIVISCLMFLLQGHKGPILGLMIAYSIFLSFKYPIKKIGLLLICLILIGLSSLIFVIMAHYSSYDIIDAMVFISTRSTIMAAEGFDKIVYFLVPYNGDYYYGKLTLMNIGTMLVPFRILPLDDLNLSMPIGVYLPTIEGRGGMQAQFMFPYTVTIFGLPYADFGFLGLVASGFAFGILIYSLYIITIRRVNDNFMFPILCFLQVKLAGYHSGGDLGGFLANELTNIVGAVVFLLMVYSFLIWHTGSVKLTLFRRVR